MEHKYIESTDKNQKYSGWHYDHITKTFYRWNDFIKVVKEHGNS